MTEPLVQVPVTNLYVQCMYPKPGVTRVVAASCCCQRSATSAVVMPKTGNLMWRCTEHRGQVEPGVTGEARDTVPQRKHPAS